ncbi:MAG: hypothetical protein RBT80_11050 [Candidatus Vecturithrix sp.]|jgi:hypothetical protein|nr:hypothetical protein [Candidatus Vecturithrix sp.]
MKNASRTYADLSTATAVTMLMVGNSQHPEQFAVSAGKKNITTYAVWLFEQDFW